MNATEAITVIETANDRCDECGARAFVYAQFTNGPLSWCGHHAAIHWEAITTQASAVIDLRHTILPT